MRFECFSLLGKEVSQHSEMFISKIVLYIPCSLYKLEHMFLSALFSTLVREAQVDLSPEQWATREYASFSGTCPSRSDVSLKSSHSYALIEMLVVLHEGESRYQCPYFHADIPNIGMVGPVYF